MRCIFCKLPSDGSTSVEHIIPESLGNVDHVLPRGVVCDVCNNYFARKVEAPFLASGLLREQRFEMSVASKRGRIPSIRGVFASPLFAVELSKTPDELGTGIMALDETREAAFVHALQSSKAGRLYVPKGTPPPDVVTARFVGKVGLEALAFRVLDVPGALEEIVNKPELDALRSYVRRGYPESPWPVHQREVYPSGRKFTDGAEPFEVLHEFTFLYTDECELYIVLAIFGVEYVMNLGERSLSGYHRWLSEHNNASPLYPTDA